MFRSPCQQSVWGSVASQDGRAVACRIVADAPAFVARLLVEGDKAAARFRAGMNDHRVSVDHGRGGESPGRPFGVELADQILLPDRCPRHCVQATDVTGRPHHVDSSAVDRRGRARTFPIVEIAVFGLLSGNPQPLPGARVDAHDPFDRLTIRGGLTSRLGLLTLGLLTLGLLTLGLLTLGLLTLGLLTLGLLTIRSLSVHCVDASAGDSNARVGGADFDLPDDGQLGRPGRRQRRRIPAAIAVGAAPLRPVLARQAGVGGVCPENQGHYHRHPLTVFDSTH